jgi:hypothetical protein
LSLIGNAEIQQAYFYWLEGLSCNFLFAFNLIKFYSDRVRSIENYT